MNRREHLLLWGAGCAAGTAGVGWAWRHHHAGDLLPDDVWRLRFGRPEGGEFELSSMRGQAVVLNFWATWCPPCVKELPEFDRLYRSRTGNGVQVIGLAIDQPAAVRQFLARQPVSFPIGLAGFEGSDLSRRLGNRDGALPFTVVMDRNGRLRHRKLGPTEFGELSSWIAGL